MRILDVLVAFLVPSVLTLLIARDMWRSVQPMRLMVRGRYAEARAAAADLATSWMRWVSGVRTSAPYMIALANHLEGNLEEAGAELRRLASGVYGPLDPNTTFAVQSLEVANLVLQQTDPDRVLRLLSDTAKVRVLPRDELMAAITLLALDRREEAETHFVAAGTELVLPEPKRGTVVLLWDKALEGATFFTLRGMYLRQIGRETEAVEALLRASAPYDSDKTNVYVEGARRLLDDASLAAPEP